MIIQLFEHEEVKETAALFEEKFKEFPVNTLTLEDELELFLLNHRFPRDEAFKCFLIGTVALYRAAEEDGLEGELMVKLLLLAQTLRAKGLGKREGGK